MMSIRIFCILLLFTSSLVSCDYEEVTLARPNDNYRPAAGYLKNNYEFRLLSAALERAGLLDEFNGPGPFTVFAPNDQAFNEWGIQRPSDFDRLNPDSLRFMLRYHVLNRRLAKIDLATQIVDDPFSTLACDSVFMATRANYGTWFINGAQITRENIPLSNGLLHVINKVLKYNPSTVQQLLENRPDYRIFTAALKKFGLWGQLAEEGPWTVMAPTNAAFEKAQLTLADIEALDPQAYGKRLFGAYIFSSRFFKTDLLILSKSGSSGSYAKDGAPIRLPIPGDEGFDHGIGAYEFRFFVAANGSNSPVRSVVFAPQEARIDYLNTNGVLHELDDLVLLPDETILRP